MGDRQMNAEQEPPPQQRGGEVVDADRRKPERRRQQDEREVPRRRDEQLERPPPALALHRRARGGADGRPHPHHGSAERCVDQRPRAVARAEDEERRRGEEQRVDDVADPVEGRAHDHLELEPPADRQQPERAHSDTRAT